jgi:hypothetical protein
MTTMLQRTERVAGRAFCDPGHTERDLAILGRLRSALRKCAREQRLIAFSDDTGDHTVAVPDWTALARSRQVAVIGFFGQARRQADHSAILELERDIVARAGAFPGLLAYHNTRLAEGGWGNMVVFASRAETAGLTADPAHIRAVQRTPRHYDSLRLHRGTLPDGLLGASGVALAETLYLDFSADRPWRALRTYPGRTI